MKNLDKFNSRMRILKDQLSGNNTSWVMKFVEYDPLPIKTQSLKGKTLFITGASRGIGLAIAIKAAKQGANIAVVAKTVTEQKNLPGTIFTAVDEINSSGGKGLAIQCDIRDEESVKKAVEETVKIFGGIDVLVNNASAISLTSTEETAMKKYDLMHSINTRGTFLCTKYCIPYLKKSDNPHILTLSPPINLEERWLNTFPAYSLSKFGMSILAKSFAYELKNFGIASNTLWPRTAIATAAVKNLLGGETVMESSREASILGDCAVIIFNSDSRKVSGNHYVDDELLASNGISDLSKYRCNDKISDFSLVPDFFC